MRALSFATLVSLHFMVMSDVKSIAELIADSAVRANMRSSPTTATPPSFSLMRSLPAIKVDPSGNVYTTQILKQQLANELGLPLRDLRIVDPSYPSQIQATFTSRKKAILFCIENVKVVVQHHEALVFSPYQPEVQEFVPALQQQIIMAKSVDMFGSTGGVSRFEHIVLEAALNVVCGNLVRKVRALSPAVTSALNGLRAESRGLDVLQTQIDELLPLKNKVDELSKRVKEIKRAITEVLCNDEDLNMMYLEPLSNISHSFEVGDESNISPLDSPIPVNINPMVAAHFVAGATMGSPDSLPPPVTDVIDGIADTMNLEMLFENYLNEVEWIASEIEDIIDEITNTEESVALQLNLLNNRILRFELSLSISSFVVTCGALVTGLFGMNLLSHLETNNNVFYIVTGFLAASMMATWTSFMRFGRRERIF